MTEHGEVSDKASRPDWGADGSKAQSGSYDRLYVNEWHEEEHRKDKYKRGTHDELFDDIHSGRMAQDTVLGEEPGRMKAVTIDREQLTEYLRLDHAALIKLLLAEEEGIEKGVPDFHIFIMTLMCGDDPRVCIAIPRDHAKTTLAKIAAVWTFIYTPSRFLVYLSNTHSVAAAATKDIVNFIRSPVMCQIFGEPVFIRAEDSKGNYEFEWRGKVILIKALGAGQQVRGLNQDNKRPDIAIVDDIESAEEMESNKLGYDKLKKWFYGTFRKSLDRRRNKIIQIGNLVSNKSVLKDHLESPNWKSLRLGAFTKDGQVLWPARWTLQALKEEMIEYAREGQLFTWLAEMLNMPMSSASGLLPQSEVSLAMPVTPDSDEITMRCITVDPAISKNMAMADSAVVVAHVYVRGAWQLAEKVSAKGQSPYDVFATIMELAIKWRVRTVGIESDAFQQALIYICQVEAARIGYKLMNFVPVSSGKVAKVKRILTWVGMIKKGDYRLTANDMDLWRQIQDYDIHSNKNKDDEIDCCAYIIQMQARYREQLGKYHGVSELVQPVSPPDYLRMTTA